MKLKTYYNKMFAGGLQYCKQATSFFGKLLKKKECQPIASYFWMSIKKNFFNLLCVFSLFYLILTHAIPFFTKRRKRKLYDELRQLLFACAFRLYNFYLVNFTDITMDDDSLYSRLSLSHHQLPEKELSKIYHLFDNSTKKTLKNRQKKLSASKRRHRSCLVRNELTTVESDELIDPNNFPSGDGGRVRMTYSVPSTKHRKKSSVRFENKVDDCLLGKDFAASCTNLRNLRRMDDVTDWSSIQETISESEISNSSPCVACGRIKGDLLDKGYRLMRTSCRHFICSKCFLIHGDRLTSCSVCGRNVRKFAVKE
ncbi:hypothetical protein SNEBB_005368 [Seison nebaliae]|nr:hypothetical protein SNEBB_005368 [Seison nebaliae]